MNGKKEVKDLINETLSGLNKAKAEAESMLFNAEYKNRRLLEKLIDAIWRSKDDIRRSTAESDYRL